MALSIDRKGRGGQGFYREVGVEKLQSMSIFGKGSRSLAIPGVPRHC